MEFDSIRKAVSRTGHSAALGRRSRCAAVVLGGVAIFALAGSTEAFAHDPTDVAERVSVRTSVPLSSQRPSALPGLIDAMPLADRIVVRKGERRLYLMRGSTVLRSYKVALGLNPIGQKERSGDYRTPEGRYFLTRRNPHSDYFLSIQVSYPNGSDLERARRHRWDAGGAIMIHGLPNRLHRPPEYYEKYDWTDGCIAVSDSDMVEIWLMTQEGTPIDILP
ncbi:MAG TPA: L,D-transpeptidase family protein [Steroidobacteraceae bacterium]|nr:L,D-transpeptidase family protein [Steroidobacteraceae bacterium]